MSRFDRVAVIGVGLVGGSFALALKAAKLCGQVVGVGRNPDNMTLARERGAIDSIAADPAAAVAGASLVLVATPVAQFGKVFSAIGPRLAPAALVTDAGSTKRDVIAAARAGLGGKISQYVPAHPVAGAEKSGAAAASADLFKNRRVVITPLPENSPQNIQVVQEIWTALGARVSRMSPEEHDEVFAAVSHLPHLLAYALVSELGSRANSRQLFGYAAGGFRDFTRIASSHPEMWRDVCVANHDRLVKEVSRFSEKLDHIRRLLETRDAAALEKLFAEARAARERWLNGKHQ